MTAVWGTPSFFDMMISFIYVCLGYHGDVKRKYNCKKLRYI